MKTRYKRNHAIIMSNSRIYPLARCVIDGDREALEYCSHGFQRVPVFRKIKSFLTAISQRLRSLGKVFVLGIALVLISCGTEQTQVCEAGAFFLAGTWTSEEALALTDVTAAIARSGYIEMNYGVVFIHSPDTPFHGTTWKDWRINGIEPSDPSVGYGGYVDRDLCLVYVNRCGSKERHLYGLLVHELVHALGYDHGNEMRRVEDEILDYLE